MRQTEAPLQDSAAVQSTRRALKRALDLRVTTLGWSCGRTKWNRVRTGLPKSHTLDALVVGEFDSITQTVSKVLVAGCSGRGTHCRTRSDKHGFPRLLSASAEALLRFRHGRPRPGGRSHRKERQDAHGPGHGLLKREVQRDLARNPGPLGLGRNGFSGLL